MYWNVKQFFQLFGVATAEKRAHTSLYARDVDKAMAICVIAAKCGPGTLSGTYP